MTFQGGNQSKRNKYMTFFSHPQPWPTSPNLTRWYDINPAHWVPRNELWQKKIIKIKLEGIFRENFLFYCKKPNRPCYFATERKCFSSVNYIQEMEWICETTKVNFNIFSPHALEQFQQKHHMELLTWSHNSWKMSSKKRVLI